LDQARNAHAFLGLNGVKQFGQVKKIRYTALTIRQTEQA
jgi:hypothetical protein